MSIIVQSDIHDEFLTKEEIERITGYSSMRGMMSWLDDKQWEFGVNHKNEIIIGRWYARLKMAGVSLQNIELEQTTYLPNLDKAS